MTNKAAESDQETQPKERIYYFYALRDSLPLDDDWLVTAYEIPPDGHAREFRCGLVRVASPDHSLAQASQALHEAIAKVKGTKTTHLPNREGADQEASLFVGVVAADLGEDEDIGTHQELCFTRLRGVLRGLRLATLAPIHDLTIERVWPIYCIGRQVADQPLEVTNLILVGHGFQSTHTASQEQLEEAVRLADATAAQHPVTIYRDFELSAQVAAWQDGDYVAAVLNAATACEVLIKHTAWLLTWEAMSQLEEDPHPTAKTHNLVGMKPGELVGGVCAPRLRGNWTTQHAVKPLGQWRQHIAQLRNIVVHRGYRPEEEAAKQAVATIDVVEQHVLDRLAAATRTYPRTALLLAGRTALEKRGSWHTIQDFAAAAPIERWLSDYFDWLAAFEEDSEV